MSANKDYGTGSGKIPDTPSIPPPPQPKPQELNTVRRELERTARQLDGLSKSLKRLNERIGEAA